MRALYDKTVSGVPAAAKRSPTKRLAISGIKPLSANTMATHLPLTRSRTKLARKLGDAGASLPTWVAPITAEHIVTATTDQRAL